MYTVPLYWQIQALVNQRVDQVCFGESNTTISFDSGDYITFEGAVSFYMPNSDCANNCSGGPSSSCVIGIVGDVTSKVERLSDRVLELTWHSGARLVLPSEEQWESYKIRVGDQEFIV